MEKDKLSPMMQNYMKTKQEYSDCIIFYRLGDFYEMFFDDAKLVSRELELTLTGRECGLEQRAPMCGVPYHSATIYIDKLVRNGHKVAICEQLEDPREVKGIVKRGVVRVITPGTAYDDNVLEEKSQNYLMSIVKKGAYFGVAIIDVSTGEFKTTKIQENYSFEKLIDEISRYNPKEIIVNKQLYENKTQIEKIKQRFNAYITKGDDKSYQDKFEKEFISKRIRNFKIYLDNLILENDHFLDNKEFELERDSIFSIIGYINETQKISLEHINKIYVYKNTKYMTLDINARKSLELTQRLKDGARKGTLLNVVDKTKTSMGARLLNRWISDPLLDKEEIVQRQESVLELTKDPMKLSDLRDILNAIYDIERICGKISFKNASPRDLVSLKNSIIKLPVLKFELKDLESPFLKELWEKLDTLEDVYEMLDNAIEDNPPLTLKEGNVIKHGYDKKLDELKAIAKDSKIYLNRIEYDEKKKTGIKNLKISYNKVFGYFFEVTKSNLHLVPKHFIRKQTLTNAERFITPELKELEENILSSSEQISDLEYRLYCDVRDNVLQNIQRIQNASKIISMVDCICSFALTSFENGYTKPEISEDGVMEIKDGRHPVIEKLLGENEFIPNDVFMDNTKNFHIITGPNMAGKSTYMRQIALICLMNQIRCFVPASYAKLPIMDKIMTRVGAQDDLSMGESTFMVEMMEIANILKNATPRSLLILDEIRRGTSTYDGMSIANSVANYIATNISCKTFFATHYHELTQLETEKNNIKNYHITVKENGEDIVFLRKIVEGGTDKSFGIHVAKLAGIPDKVVRDARKILKEIEQTSVVFENKHSKQEVSGQMDLFNLQYSKIADELNQINMNEITPITAFNILNKLKEMAE